MKNVEQKWFQEPNFVQRVDLKFPGKGLLLVIWEILASTVGIFALISSMFAMMYRSKPSEFVISLIGLLAPISAFFGLIVILEKFVF